MGGEKKSLVHFQACDNLDKDSPKKLFIESRKQRRRKNEVPQGSG